MSDEQYQKTVHTNQIFHEKYNSLQPLTPFSHRQQNGLNHDQAKSFLQEKLFHESAVAYNERYYLKQFHKISDSGDQDHLYC